jgi:ubiquitin fusion degradation protein 1
VQRVTVKYASLPKGTSVTLQPRGSSFVEDVASDWRGVKGVLENAMRSHTTLTTGDWLTIEHAGRGYDGKFVNVAVEKWSAVKSVDTLRTH